MELSCTICMETIIPSESISSTQCGHMFHTICVTKWFNKSNTCPDCRTSSYSSDLIRLHLSLTPEDEYKSLEDQIGHLINQMDSLKLQIKEKNNKIQVLTKQNTDLTSQMAEMRLKKLNENLKVE